MMLQLMQYYTTNKILYKCIQFYVPVSSVYSQHTLVLVHMIIILSSVLVIINGTDECRKYQNVGISSVFTNYKYFCRNFKVTF